MNESRTGTIIMVLSGLWTKELARMISNSRACS